MAFAKVSFAKMKNGKYGVRVAKGVDKKAGDEVTVEKANGETSEVVLGKMVEENQYGDRIFEFVSESK